MVKHWTETVKVGDEVSYRDVNLWFQRGKLLSIGKGKQGGDCVVQWDRSGIKSEECLFNFYAWKEEAEIEIHFTQYRCRWCRRSVDLRDGESFPAPDSPCAHEWRKVGAP